MNRRIIGQYFCYIFALAMSWVLIGQLIQYNIKISELVKIDGLIGETIEVAKPRPKSKLKDYELRIFLQDTTEYYRLMDIYKYQHFRAQIKKGDTAQIYIRPKWLVNLAMGHRNDIFQMNINGKIIFDISQTKRNTKGIIVLELIVIPLFIFLGLYIKRKK